MYSNVRKGTDLQARTKNSRQRKITFLIFFIHLPAECVAQIEIGTFHVKIWWKICLPNLKIQIRSETSYHKRFTQTKSLQSHSLPLRLYLIFGIIKVTVKSRYPTSNYLTKSLLKLLQYKSVSFTLYFQVYASMLNIGKLTYRWGGLYTNGLHHFSTSPSTILTTNTFLYREMYRLFCSIQRSLPLVFTNCI